MENDLKYLLALTQIDLVGPVTGRNLIAYFGSAEAVFRARKGKLIKVPGVGEKIAHAIREADTVRRAEHEMAWCEKHSIDILTIGMPEYPERLRQLYDAPLVIFKKGTIGLNERPTVGIVGTRKPTAQGRAIAARFASEFAAASINVVSGLALGIDIESHAAALASGGVTTAVLGHGLDRMYPRHHTGKAREIAVSGALITEFFTGTKPDKVNFPARNRILSGLCQALIVVEAASSGGALITARFAFQQNREVYAVPGNIDAPASQGCNALIRDNVAKLITSASEVLEDLQLPYMQETPRGEIPTAPLSPEERKVLDLLHIQPMLIDDIAIQSSIAIHKLHIVLLGLEVKGMIRQMPGKKFCVV